MTQQEVKYKDFKCAISSFVANYISGILHPFDVIKTRFQSHDGKNINNLVPKYNGIFNAFKQIYQFQGIQGLYKGFYMSLLSQAIASSFFFWIKQYYSQKNIDYMTSVSLASLQAGTIVTIITQPFWVIKTRMLLNIAPNTSQISNFLQKTKQIHVQHGYYGFTKGLGVNLMLALIGITQMYIYEGSKLLYDYIKIPQSQFLQKNFICGGISKILSGLITFPFTTIRTRIQQNQYIANQKQQKYSGIIDITSKTWKQQGIRGFYKGLYANILKGIPQRGIYFYCYELIKLKIFNIEQTKQF